VAWKANDADVVAEVLAAELRTDARLLGQLEHLLFEVHVAEGMAELGSAGGQRIEVASAG
jgi:hypothetical protein